MEKSVLQLIIEWVQKDTTLDGIAIRTAYDILKYSSKSLWERTKRFFKNKQEVDKFFEAVQLKENDSQKTLDEQISLIYKEVCNRSLSIKDKDDLLKEIKTWLIDAIPQTNQVFNNNNIKLYQRAGRDIINVQGTLNINNNRGD